MSSNSTKSILVVEDDAGVMLLQRKALERCGLKVTTVTSVDDAMAAIEVEKFDVVVSDYRLEEATGLDLCRSMRSVGADIPVILVTGYSDEATLISAIRCGVRDFVPKTAEYLSYLPKAVERVIETVALERELAKSEARFHLFMENSPAAAFIKDDAGRMVYANRAAQECLDRDDWLGKTDAELYSPETAALLRRHDEAVLAGGEVLELQERIALLDGRMHHFRVYKFPMQDADGQRLIGGVAVDLTQQHEAEVALRERDEQLRQAQKMEAVGTLAGGVAHEFNNLLQAILGYSKFARDSLSTTDQAREDLDVVIKAAERAASLTKQLLQFSRRSELELVPMDLTQAVAELTQMLGPLFGETIDLIVELPQRPLPILGHACTIQQILLNLCVNARDAMQNGGQLRISASTTSIEEPDAENGGLEPGRYALLSVHDNGTGMTPDVKDHLFEPFYTTKDVGHGTGLGLAMVYGGVEQHRGRIRVSSQLGTGTKFDILLPLQELASEKVEPAGVGLRDQKTILLAEDELMVQDLITRLLTGAGYEVLVASNGADALTILEAQQHRVQLFLMDVVMPGMSWKEVIAAAKAISPELPILFCSGHASDASFDAFINDNDYVLITKPFDADALLDAVRASLMPSTLCLC